MRKATNRTHGMAGTPEYVAWQAIIRRCTRPQSADYGRYGGAGITVCKEWLSSFSDFFKHMGPRPSVGHSIDRINGSKGYEPGNVRWATLIEQANNKKTNRIVIYQRRKMTVAEAGRAAGGIVRRETIICRLRNGWGVAEAVETPPLFRRDPVTRKKIMKAE